MADLDFTRSVPDVPASSGPGVPAPYHRQETVQPVRMPDFQSAMTQYAADTNWMSFIGSQVAAKASDAVAQKIGGEMGKNPQGDIGPSFTDFDKTMKASYNQQAQATLGLQANKLLTDSSIATAQATRITPELIAKTNESITKGMQSILKNAPDEVKPHMELQFGSAMLDQNAQLQGRMLREQKEDQRNNTALATDMNTQHAYSFGLNGNEKAGQAAVENTKRLNDSAAAARLITPEDAKTRTDSARQSYLSGKMIHDYNNSKDKEAFLKSVADKKPGYLSDSDYMSVTNSLMQYVNHQDALRSQDQSLRLAKFQTSVAMNPMAPDMASQLQDLKNNISPEAYEKAQLHYVNAVKSWNTEQGNVNNALASWNDPSSFARLSEKGINKAFDMQVNRYVQQREQQGSPISVDEAEVQVAASAGGKVPVFEKSLENKLLSGNPQNIQSAAGQMAMLDDMERGNVYAGVSQKAKAIATLFTQQRGSMPDQDLARQITDNLSNVDEKMQKTLDNSWSLILSSKGAGGLGSNKTLGDFALQEMGISGKYGKKANRDFFDVVYGNDIYNQLNSNFIATRGDYSAAKKMTKDYVDQHYGDTFINGKKQFSDSPIEKYLGYPGDGITPFVQKDLWNQLNTSFANSKDHNPHDYWETLPLKNGVVEAKRTVNGKEYRYPVNLVGRAGNQWDVVVQTPNGIRNLFLIAPHIGVTHYTPNKEAIVKDYSEHKKKGWFS
jgi:hypothetical protein